MSAYDYSNVPTTEFESLPEDWYSVTISKTDLSTSDAGNEVLKITYKVTNGEFKNRTLFDNWVFSEKTWWKLKKILEVIKSPAADGKRVVPAEIRAFADGITLEVFAEPDVTNTGKATNKIKNYRAVGSATANAASALYQ